MSDSSTTFPVKVPGIGTFTFRKRTIGDAATILVDYDAILGGAEKVSPLLDSLATALATYPVLVASHPPGWEPATIKEMDALASDGVSDLLRVFGALSAREDEFRPLAHRRFKAQGEGVEGQPGDVVSADLQPPAD